MKAFSIICVISILLFAGCSKSKKQQETPQAPSVAVDHPQLRTVIYTFEYPGYLQAEQRFISWHEFRATWNLINLAPGTTGSTKGKLFS